MPFFVFAPIALFSIALYGARKRWLKNEKKEAVRLEFDREGTESFDKMVKRAEEKHKRIEPKLRGTNTIPDILFRSGLHFDYM